MAFVVKRPGHRWEIRESYTTDDGPRARTLASFNVLTADVLDRAVARSEGHAEREALIRAAKRAGAPLERPEADIAAETLIRVMARGAPPRPGLQRLLMTQLGPLNQRDNSFAEWIGASLEERARALVDLLDLGDTLPHPPERPLRCPRLAPAARR